MMKVLLTLRSNWIADELESGSREKFEGMVNSQIKLDPDPCCCELSEKEQIKIFRKG